MLIIKEQWEQALEEFNDLAFKRFLILFKSSWLNAQDNKTIEMSLDCVKLKPIDKLFKHDVQVYREHAYFMWKLEYKDKFSPKLSDNEDISHYLRCKPKYPVITRKIRATRLPFDLERAKFGDAFYSIKDDDDLYGIGTNSANETVIWSDNGSGNLYWQELSCVNLENLQMKYPKRVK